MKKHSLSKKSIKLIHFSANKTSNMSKACVTCDSSGPGPATWAIMYSMQ